MLLITLYNGYKVTRNVLSTANIVLFRLAEIILFYDACCQYENGWMFS